MFRTTPWSSQQDKYVIFSSSCTWIVPFDTIIVSIFQKQIGNFDPILNNLD